MGGMRQLFNHEERDFTPWLKEHLNLLTENGIIDYELEPIEIEKFVDLRWKKRVDLLTRVKGTEGVDEHLVVIENQYKSSDFDHLGRLLYYAMKCRAKTGIWIAWEFEKAHVDVMEELSESNLGIKFIPISVSNPDGNKDKNKIIFHHHPPLFRDEVRIGDILGAVNQDDKVTVDEELKDLIESYELEYPNKKAVSNKTTIGTFQEWIMRKDNYSHESVEIYWRYYKNNDKSKYL